LPRHRMAVLQARMADGTFVDAGPLRQQARDVGGVHPALLDGQQQVLSRAAGLEAIELGDVEVLGRHPDACVEYRDAMGARQRIAHARTSRQTACAAMPSSRPMKPRRSLVVALTLTASSAMPKSAAIASR